MRIGLFLYRIGTRLLAAFVSLAMRRRIAKQKEDPETLSHRFAKNLPKRPEGLVVWLHGASVGESKLCLLTADALQNERSDLTVLHTCQTLTGAALIKSDIADKSRRFYSPAPIDTPTIARRFITHWMPNLAIFSEGEIWPNLLSECRAKGTKTALINARMTEKSLNNWARWPSTAKTVIGGFDLIATSDQATATALQTYAPHAFSLPSNLKTDLPAPLGDEAQLTLIKSSIADRAVLLAASTHPGEDTIALDAVSQITPRPFLILAPRHPERGDEIETLALARGHKIARRSRSEQITPDTTVLLADTMGEMGLWIRLADTVYLGGGHTPDIGGHNPLEAIQLGKPVLTGPDVFNFKTMMTDLETQGALTFIEGAQDLARAFPAPIPPKLSSGKSSPLPIVVKHLLALLPPSEQNHA
ncbi:MAG: glycosyltransferase N-terminal domain-containing protein [Pseudomonadota bacterium]